MPRKLRLQYPGAIYHISSRGGRRGKIFLTDADRKDFLKTLAQTCLKTGFQVHAFCLMPEHYHLVVETPSANLAVGMAWLQSAYTIRFNRRHDLSGPVFSGRYRSMLIEGSGKGYLQTACDCVHLSPVRAKLLRKNDPLMAYPWSSFGLYLAAREHRPAWLRVDRLLGEHGFRQDNARARKAFKAQMEARRVEAAGKVPVDALRRGWYLGSVKFRAKMLKGLAGKSGAGAAGGMRMASARAKAKRILRQELARRGWDAGTLRKRRKSDPEKLAIGARLRRETTLSVREIAAMVRLGTYNSAHALLHRWMREQDRSAAA